MQTDVEFDLNSIMTQAGSENFPVAMKALPARPRAHLLAVYGFARLVDDIGDEYDGDRQVALDWLEAELQRARAGQATHPVMVQLTPLFDDLAVADEPFLALIEANRLDQHKHRYRTQAELAEYCTLSANPVGRLVLAVFEVSTPERVALSDAVCSGLQVVEHLQDIGEDYTDKGRIYLPADEMARFGVSETDLGAATASESLRRLVAHQCDTARGLLLRGRPLAASLTGWAKVTVAGYVAGGLAALDAIARADHDVLAGLRSPTKARTALHTLGLVAPRSVADAAAVRTVRKLAARRRRR
ncbi:squalene synthase HpnC [Candidatus Poriferisocius sp.]|uniref:squalene synthase HpnC n=1 Tax=Candidatus Poriferisocius sp. TaxID=3101276 RepID=UPI003B5B2B41